jgi:hypothetical protein
MLIKKKMSCHLSLSLKKRITTQLHEKRNKHLRRISITKLKGGEVSTANMDGSEARHWVDKWKTW